MLLPLKQGLKHDTAEDAVRDACVVMLLPLKQGLKQVDSQLCFVPYLSCYATSIKTRIETS